MPRNTYRPGRYDPPPRPPLRFRFSLRDMLIIAAIAPPLLWGGWMFYEDHRASIDRRAAMKVQDLKRAKLSAQYRSIEQAKVVAAHYAKVAASEAKRARIDAARKNRRAAWLDRPSRPARP